MPNDSPGWLNRYQELRDYIAQNPAIEIEDEVTVIPEPVRPEFYRLFAASRADFVKETFPELLNEGTILGKAFNEARETLLASLRLDDIKVDADINWFITNPVDGLARPLFNPLFDLLKGRFDVATFETIASRLVTSSFSRLHKIGYQNWVLFSLVNLAAPSKLLRVFAQEASNSCTVMEDHISPGSMQDVVPEPKQAKEIDLRHCPTVSFVVPDLIVQSTTLACCLSVRTAIIDPWWVAQRVSEKRHWIELRKQAMPYEPITDWPDMVIYLDDKPEDIALVADYTRFCQPDVIIECKNNADWYEKEGLDRVKFFHDLLQPTHGTFVISRVPVPKEALWEVDKENYTGIGPSAEDSSSRTVGDSSGNPPSHQELDPKQVPTGPSSIRILYSDYNPATLRPIISALTQA